jgi:hypothetical protein
MQHLALDFTKSAPRYNAVVVVCLFLCVALITAFFVLQQQQLSNEIARITRQKTGVQVAGIPAKSSPDLERKISATHQTLRALNMPWEPMLSALEQAQQENPNIKLLSIQPKPEKGEVVISGVAPEFDALVKYLNSLRLQPGLGDAVLLNQHWEQNGGAENAAGQDKLMFNLAVVWLP